MSNCYAHADQSLLLQLPGELFRSILYKYSDGKSLSMLLLTTDNLLIRNTCRMVLRDRLKDIQRKLAVRAVRNGSSRQSLLLQVLDRILSRPELLLQETHHHHHHDALAVRNLSRLLAFLDYCELLVETDNDMLSLFPLWQGRVLLGTNSQTNAAVNVELLSSYWHPTLLQKFHDSMPTNFHLEPRRFRTVPPRIGIVVGKTEADQRKLREACIIEVFPSDNVWVPPRRSNNTTTKISTFWVTPRKAKQNLFETSSSSTRAILDLAENKSGLICIWTEEESDDDDDDNNLVDSLEFVLPIQEFLRTR